MGPWGIYVVSPSVLERVNFSEVGKAMLVTGLVLLVSAAALLFTTEEKLKHSNEEVQRATAALLRIDEINDLVIGVDYTARGYALSGLALFREHEQQKQARLDKVVDELAAYLSPSQRSKWSAFNSLVDKHADVYAALVAKGPNRVQEAAAVITDPVERKKRYDVLVAVQQLKAGELHALATYQRESEQQLRQTSLLTMAIVVLAFLGGMTDVMARIWRYRRRRGVMRTASVPRL